jgi:hypothetical protein
VEELYFAVMAGVEPDEIGPWDSKDLSADAMKLFINSSSKGLVEVTSAPSTVQFIHESVRDFLLGENGICQVSNHLGIHEEGSSHEKLMQCCYAYIKSDFSVLIPPHGPPFNAAEGRKEEFGELILKTFPFLHYALANVFVYAKQSLRGSISPDKFIADFDIHTWVRLYNATVKFQKLPSTISLLYVLAMDNHAELIKLILRNGSQTHVPNGPYEHPFYAALANKHMESVAALCMVDADMHQHETHRECYCHQATEELTSLLTPNLDLPLKRYPSLISHQPLLFLLERGKVSLARCMLSSSAISDSAMQKLGPPALAYAAHGGDKEIVDVLLAKGVDVNSRNEFGSTVLYTASLRGHEKVVGLLLAKGADVNAERADSSTALHAASSRGNSETVKVLLARGADVSVRGGYFDTALQAASSSGNEETVKVLLAEGANVNLKGGYYGTALHAASYFGHEKIVRLLLDAGADVTS